MWSSQPHTLYQQPHLPGSHGGKQNQMSSLNYRLWLFLSSGVPTVHATAEGTFRLLVHILTKDSLVMGNDTLRVLAIMYVNKKNDLKEDEE